MVLLLMANYVSYRPKIHLSQVFRFPEPLLSIYFGCTVNIRMNKEFYKLVLCLNEFHCKEYYSDYNFSGLIHLVEYKLIHLVEYNMINVSVILPCYNEAENIISMIEVVDSVLSELKAEIIIVDDNSPDGTSSIVEGALARYEKLRLITRKSDKGLVQAISEGIRKSRGKICIWMDADLSMPAGKILVLLDRIEDGADLAIGSRYVEGGGIKGATPHIGKTGIFHVWKNLLNTEDSIFAVTISKYGNLFARYVLDGRYYDYTSGFYAIKKDVIEDVGLEGEYLDYCINLLYKTAMKGYRIDEIPVSIVPRMRGKSKTSNNLFAMISIGFECILLIIKLKLTVRKRKFQSNAKM